MPSNCDVEEGKKKDNAKEKKKEWYFSWIGREFMLEKNQNNVPGHQHPDAMMLLPQVVWLIQKMLINIFAAGHGPDYDIHVNMLNNGN